MLKLKAAWAVLKGLGLGKLVVPLAIAALLAAGFGYVTKLRADVREARAEAVSARSERDTALEAAENMKRQAEALAESERAASEALADRLSRIGRARDVCLDERLPAELLD